MARIDKAVVRREAADAVRRLQVVSEDPAVIKAAKQAGQDVAQAARSCVELGNELRASWGRSA